MIGSYTARFVSVALTVVGVGISAKSAIAQTTYPFSGNYDTVINITPITDSVSLSTELATSTDANAPYGLTQYQGIVYGQTDPTTGVTSFDSNPGTFGLPDLPPGYIVLQGENTDNKLFGTATASAVFDRQNLVGNGSGTLNITGGEGLFTNASGTLNFQETDTLNPDPNVLSVNGQALITGSIQTPAVPEPKGEIGTVAAIGLIGVGLMVRRNRQRNAIAADYKGNPTHSSLN